MSELYSNLRPFCMQSFSSLHKKGNSIPSSIIYEKCSCSKCWSNTVLGHCLIISVSRVCSTTLCVTFILSYYHIFQLQGLHGPQNFNLLISYILCFQGYRSFHCK
uniref:Uncharacterized protein n=1 Tax=Arundo donax TaxID=35708 RepID=A0A0A9DXR5_ARUDO